jgi:catechol 2,3-dioxygenase-like lactoylglutathione lyase family enzyme
MHNPRGRRAPRKKSRAGTTAVAKWRVYAPRMRVSALVVSVILSTTVAVAAGNPSMRPTLVALQVESLDASVAWYSNYLGFKPSVRREFPGLKIAILALEDFELELVENPKTLKKAALLSDGATDITGFAKVTFTVDDVGKLFRQLRDKGAEFAIPLRDSNTRPDQQFFVVLDNEKNWLQFAGAK